MTKEEAQGQEQADTPVAEPAEGGYRRYVRAWLVLLVLTAIGVIAAQAPLSQRGLLLVLVLIATLKIAVIAFEFMHLRYEHAGLVLIFISPFLFGLLMYFGTAPDFGLFIGPR